MPRVHLGIIGCGIAARDLHLPALQKIGNRYQIEMVCSRTRESAVSFAKLAGGPRWTTDYRKVLDDHDVQAVALLLPVEMNLAVTREALDAGKHVLVEKPLAATMAECRDMVRLASKTKLVAMLAENYRYRPAIRGLRKLIDAGKFGEVYAVQWICSGDVAPETSRYARVEWRLKHKYPGGFPMDGGVHQVHALRYLFGEITEVRAWTRSVNPAIGDVDTVNMEFDTATGVHGVFCHYFSARGFWQDRMTIFGTAATGVLQNGNLCLYRRDKKPKDYELRDNGGYVDEYKAFHAAITTGKPVEATFEEGLRDFRVIDTALRSAEKRKALQVG